MFAVTRCDWVPQQVKYGARAFQVLEIRRIVSNKNREAMQQRTDWGDLLQPDILATPASAQERKLWRRPDW